MISSKTTLKSGDSVMITDTKKNSKIIYNILKIKKDQDGTLFYLLNSKSYPITLLYYENEESHLKKVN